MNVSRWETAALFFIDLPILAGWQYALKFHGAVWHGEGFKQMWNNVRLLLTGHKCRKLQAFSIVCSATAMDTAPSSKESSRETKAAAATIIERQ